MDKNDFIVVFSADNARVVHGIEKGSFSGAKNIIVNPDLSAVAGLPPHHWKIEADKIVPMTAAECEARDALHAQQAPAPASDTRAIIAALVKKNHYFRLVEIAVVVVTCLVSLIILLSKV